MSITFVADKGSVCTVVLVRQAGEFRVHIGEEELTTGDLVRISDAIQTLSEEDVAFAEAPRQPKPKTKTLTTHKSRKG